MKTSAFIIILLFAFSNEKINAQPDWLWAQKIGGKRFDIAASFVLDSIDNIYTVGYTADTFDFDPGPGIHNIICPNQNAFISKFDSAGNFLWVKLLGGSGFAYGFTIALDHAGNIFVAGFFGGAVDFNPDTSVNYTIVSAGSDDAFVTKLDNAGNFIWTKTISSTHDQRIYCLALDDSANVFITGHFNDTTDFDPGPDSTFGIYYGYYDAFISKLDSSGTFKWVHTFGSSSGDFGYNVVVDSFGNVFTSGAFSDTVDFDPGPGIHNLISTNTAKTFVSKLDNNGNFMMTFSFNGTTGAFFHSMTIDQTGSIYFTGGLEGVVDMDPDSLGVFMMSSVGNHDILIAKFDSSGHFIWAKSTGDWQEDFGSSIAVFNDNIIITGTFNFDVDMDPGAGIALLSSGNFKSDFISNFDTSGNFKWTKGIMGTHSDVSCPIAIDPNGNIFMEGNFYHSPISLGPFTFDNSDTSFSTADWYMAKLDTSLINGMIQNNKTDDNLSVYPNPATNKVTISFKGARNNTELIIVDMTGKIFYKSHFESSQNIDISTSNFSSGMYYVKVISVNNIQMKKLIISN